MNERYKLGPPLKKIPEGYDRDNLETHPEVFRYWHTTIVFYRDLCASEENAFHPNYISQEQDALKQDWATNYAGLHQWINPPYSMLPEFTQKIAEEVFLGACVFALLPLSVQSTIHFWKSRPSRIIQVIGRLPFCVLIDGVRRPVPGNRDGSFFAEYRPRNYECKHELIHKNELLGDG